MKSITNLLLLTVIFCIITVKSFSQSSLYVSTGANFYITSGTSVYIDGLQVKPSVNYNITGENRVTRDATATPPPPTTYIQRVYHLLQILPAYSGDITIYYQDAELNGLNENTLNLNVYNGNTWNAYAATARDAANNFVTTTGLANIAINQATLAAPGLVLPVTLTAFNVQNNNCVATLTWSTATEQNTKQFELQQSADGIRYTTVAIVAASGTSTTEKNYSYTYNLTNQNNYFRLQIVDLDGSSKTSPIVSARSNCNTQKILAFPNPAKTIVTVTGLEGENKIRLFDASGKMVLAKTTTNVSEEINVSKLPAGTYILQVLQDNILIEKIMIIKQ